jgi:Fe2+ transport system protein B
MTAAARPSPILVIGKESVGKSLLVGALTGTRPQSANFRGTTVACEEYQGHGLRLVDTPGIHRTSDSDAVRAVLSRLLGGERVLVVAKATHLDDDLADLLPLVGGRQAAVAVTFWDKVAPTDRASDALGRLSLATGLPFLAIDARRVGPSERAQVAAAIDCAAIAQVTRPPIMAGWQIEPRATLLEHRLLGPVIALLLLLAPAIAAVWLANAAAALLDTPVGSATASLAARAGALPAPVAAVLAGEYGLLTMGPLLFVWALPTVAAYAFLQGAYKTSGLLDRISVALHPLTRPIGLTGRDVTRVVMGFGCNVPAVVSTRTCSGCSRETAVRAIAFGSACSYQLGATLAVFAAAGAPGLVWPFLAYLVVSTLVYVRLTAPAVGRSPLNLLVVEGRTFLALPSLGATWRETRSVLQEFVQKALPIFLLITVVASLVEWAGVLSLVSGALEPAMGLFNLPAHAALPVILSSVRKDGILLFDEPGMLAQLSSAQLLAAVYLAGTLLPCAVTALTVARELDVRFAVRTVSRQALFAVTFTLLIAWGGAAVELAG